MAAIDPQTGDELWRTSLSEGLFSSTGTSDVTVLQHEGRVYAGCFGHLFCLDARTGEKLWHNPLNGWGHNDVTLAIGDKAVQFVSTPS